MKNNKQIFSIRKFKIGVGSVLLATMTLGSVNPVLLKNEMVAKAEGSLIKINYKYNDGVISSEFYPTEDNGAYDLSSRLEEIAHTESGLVFVPLQGANEEKLRGQANPSGETVVEFQYIPKMVKVTAEFYDLKNPNNKLNRRDEASAQVGSDTIRAFGSEYEKNSPITIENKNYTVERVEVVHEIDPSSHGTEMYGDKVTEHGGKLKVYLNEVTQPNPSNEVNNQNENWEQQKRELNTLIQKTSTYSEQKATYKKINETLYNEIIELSTQALEYSQAETKPENFEQFLETFKNKINQFEVEKQKAEEEEEENKNQGETSTDNQNSGNNKDNASSEETNTETPETGGSTEEGTETKPSDNQNNEEDSTTPAPAPNTETPETGGSTEEGTETKPSDNQNNEEDSTTPAPAPNTPNNNNTNTREENTNPRTNKETKRKITLDKKLNNKKITVEFTTKDKKQYELETTEITKTEKQKIAENLQDKNLEIVVFDLKLIDKQTRKETQTKAERTVKIALTENLTNKEVKVYYINEKTNKLEEIPSTVENNVVVFQTNHFSKYAVVTKNKEKQTQNKKDNKLPKTSAVKTTTQKTNTLLGATLALITLTLLALRRKNN